MERIDGQALLWWTIPVLLVIWLGAFLLFPGFVHPMSPNLTAEEVAAFYRDAGNRPRIQYSMIVFNWFCVGLVPLLALIALQVRQMAHRTPIFSYCIIGCTAGGPTLFLIANLFWLLAAYRPERPVELTLLFNDLAWITFTCQVGFLVGQSLFLALAIYLDRQARPVFPRWVAHFNLVIAIALVPAAFSVMTKEGVLAWDGLLSFWVKNLAIGLWILVMAIVLRPAMLREPSAEGVPA
jgi:hypothetical protein